MRMGALIAIIALLALSLLVGCGADPVVDEPAGDNDVTGAGDGTYTAASNADPRGYVWAEVVIEGEAIASVELREFNDRGQEKDEDYPYGPFHQAIDELPQRFVAANSAGIDAVTGATSTSGKAMDAVAKALQRSQGYTGTFEGMFMGVSEPNQRGGWGVALVTLDGQGSITEVVLKEVADGEFKDDEYGFEPWQDAVKEMPQRFVDSGSADVDVFTGATSSSTMWIQAVEDALNKAR